MIALLIIPGILLALASGIFLRVGLEGHSPGYVSLGILMFAASVFCNSVALGIL